MLKSEGRRVCNASGLDPIDCLGSPRANRLFRAHDPVRVVVFTTEGWPENAALDYASRRYSRVTSYHHRLRHLSSGSVSAHVEARRSPNYLGDILASLLISKHVINST